MVKVISLRWPGEVGNRRKMMFVFRTRMWRIEDEETEICVRIRAIRRWRVNENKTTYSYLVSMAMLD